MTLSFKIGGYTLNNCSMQLTGYNKSSEFRSGREVLTTITMTVEGELRGTSVAEVNSSTQALINALSVQNPFVAGLFYNNQPTAHVLYANGMVGGIRILDVSFDPDPLMMVSQRSFKATFQGEFLAAEAGGTVWEQQETIQWTGDGGPKIEYYNKPFGPGGSQTITERTFIRATHQGLIVQGLFRPSAPPPLFPRPILIGEQTTYSEGVPQLILRGRVRGYSLNYTYSYIFPSPPPTRFVPLRNR